jgi:site-specific DNA recombinase
MMNREAASHSFAALYLLLQNRLYHGEVSHKGTVYAGEHPAIIEPALWDAVQEQLADHRANRPDRLNANMSSLLTGLVYDEAGDCVVPTHAAKGVKRYRYYVSARLITGSRAEAPDGVRVPAAAVETGVIDCIRRFLANGSSVFEALQPLEADLARLQPMMRRAEEIADIFSATGRADLAGMLRMVISHIEVRSDLMSITIQRSGLLALLRRADGANGATPPVSDMEGGAPIVLTVPFARRRAGRDTRLLIDGPEARQADPALVRMLIRARPSGQADAERGGQPD